MNSIDKQPVPLGGMRIPESMRGEPTCKQSDREDDFYGAACKAVISLRDMLGNMKKHVANLAVPIKSYLYNTASPPSRKELDEALKELDDAAAAAVSAARAAAAAADEDEYLTEQLKAEASKLLSTIRTDAAQLAADSRALCLVTVDKADKGSNSSNSSSSNDGTGEDQQVQQENIPVKDRKEFVKELYGDFNLQLGPISRKLFAGQTKLLALIKSIKKERAMQGQLDEEPAN